MRQRRTVLRQYPRQRAGVGCGAQHHHAVLDLAAAAIEHREALDLALTAGLGDEVGHPAAMPVGFRLHAGVLRQRVPRRLQRQHQPVVLGDETTLAIQQPGFGVAALFAHHRTGLRTGDLLQRRLRATPGQACRRSADRRFGRCGASAEEPRDYLVRDQFYESHPQNAVLKAVMDLAGVDGKAFDTIELYSCFPCVPKMARRTLGLGRDVQVAALQSRHGRDAVGHAIEQAMADIAEGLVASGVRKLVVAGGETSGAVVDRLQIPGFLVGEEIAAGVPVLRAVGAAKGEMLLALKSGNFGGPEFFSDALKLMR